MKKYLRLTLFLLFLTAASAMVSSCQEETVQPTNADGMDDWQKHNV